MQILAQAGLAWGGVVVGHLLAYALAFPGAADRHQYLARTGHGSFGTVTLLAVVAIPLAVVLHVLPAFHTEYKRGVLPTALVLSVVQIPAFGWIELAERHLSIARTAGDPAVLIGLAAQVLVALASAVLLRALYETVRMVAAKLRRRRLAPARAPRPPAEGSTVGRLVFLIRARRRAPPTPLLS